jgi:SAM-dependent methyltransferase
MLGWAHDRLIYGRRIEALARAIADALPRDVTVLDVGSGDGRLARRVMDLRPDVTLTGVDVLVRPGSFIPVREFDGSRLPFPDRAFDVVMLIDVLHHASDQLLLLREITRVARRFVLVKDHLADGVLAAPRLAIMDWVGNARHGVALPYAYWRAAQWSAAFDMLALARVSERDDLSLYAWPMSLFERGLHMMTLLRKTT